MPDIVTNDGKPINEDIGVLLSICGKCVCDGTSCHDCHILFDSKECPCDWADYDERSSLIEKIIGLIKSEEYQNLNLEQLVSILKGDLQ